MGAAESAVVIQSTKHNKVFNISVKAAMKSMPKEAIASMYKELHQLLSKEVFFGIKPSFKHKKKVIKSFLFLKEKFKSDGSFDKLKSRLVAGGHMQNREEIL
jgi:transcription elongation factor GreA-like protein